MADQSVYSNGWEDKVNPEHRSGNSGNHLVAEGIRSS
jgi:hypothetical protein